MDELDYIIMTPLQIVLLAKIKENKITEIEERFYDKLEKLKNINLQIKQSKQLRVTLVDI